MERWRISGRVLVNVGYSGFYLFSAVPRKLWMTVSASVVS